MKTASRITCNNGFTLIEILVATVLLSVGFLATFSVLWSSQQAGLYSRNMTSAATLGAEVVEQLAMRNYTGLKAGNYAFAGSSPSQGNFTRSYSIQQDVPGANMKTITVTVSWMERGTPKSRTLSTVRRAEF